MSKYLHIFFLVLNGACFVWAIKSFFKESKGKNPRFRVIRYLSYIFSVLLLYFFISSEARDSLLTTLSLLLFVLSLFLFFWAIKTVGKQTLELAYSSEHSTNIITSGPYRYFRHPFYASYLLYWLAPFFYFKTLYSLIPFVTMLILYFLVSEEEESYFMSSPVLGVFYKEYKEKTGRFFPKVLTTKIRR